MKKIELREGFLRKYRAFNVVAAFTLAVSVPALAFANPFVTLIQRFGREVEAVTRAMQMVTIPLAVLLAIGFLLFAMSNAGGNNRGKWLWVAGIVVGLVVLVAAAPNIIDWVFRTFAL